MAGVRIGDFSPAKASFKAATNIAVFANTIRISLELSQDHARAQARKPSTILKNARMIYDDFRTAPEGKVVIKSHIVDPADTTYNPPTTPPAAPISTPYLPGWTQRWLDPKAHSHPTEGGTAAVILTPETARDADHVWVQWQPPSAGLYVTPPPEIAGPASGKMLRAGSVNSGGFWSASMDAISPHEGNVDMKVRFRLWEPMLDYTTSAKPYYDLMKDETVSPSGVLPGHFADSSNQCMLILSMECGSVEEGNQNEVYGYALRNNWDEGPWPTHWGTPGFAWELVRFHGIQETIEGQIATQMSETVWKYRNLAPGDPRAGTVIKKARRYVLGRNPTANQLENSAGGRPDEAKIEIGDGIIVRVTSGWGDLYRPLIKINNDGTISPAGPNPAGKGTVNWNEIPRDPEDRDPLQGHWMWGRMKKTIDGAKVRIQAKVWFEGAEEPADWTMDILDDTPEALQGGYTGIGTATAIHQEPGLMGQGRQVGPFDIDQVHIEIPEVLPGTSVRFETRPIEAVMYSITPDFINTGTLTSTWWDEYLVGTTPGNWFVLRPQVGPMPDTKAVTNVDLRGKPMPPDRRENFLLKVDPDLDPTKYHSDRSNISLEHATRDMTDWIQPAEDDPYSRMVSPDLPRDGLAWNEPYPGAPWLGHDGTIDDAEILVKFRADTWDQSVAFWLRGSGEKGKEDGYAITPFGGLTRTGKDPDAAENEEEPELTSVAWTVHKFVNGERVALGGFSSRWENNKWFWARIRIEGSSERQAERFKTTTGFGPGGTPLRQPHDMYPYGGVKISMKFWMDGEDERNAAWGSVLDDGFNPDPFTGFSGYRKAWDEYEEFEVDPYGRYRPVVPPHDRGFFAIGGPAIGNTQRYAEIHVLSPRIPRLDSSAYEGVHNLLSEQTALGEASAWDAENVTIATVPHATFEGGQALELRATLDSARYPEGMIYHPETGELIWHPSTGRYLTYGPRVRVVSKERVSVSPGETYIALATLDNFMHQWRMDNQDSSDYWLENYRGFRVGLRWYDADGNVVPNVIAPNAPHPAVAYDQSTFTAASMRSGYTRGRPPGRPHYVGEGYYAPETGYWPVGDVRTTQRSWFDLSRTDKYGDPYYGWAFPADKPQPFRFQDKWTWWAHGGNAARALRRRWYHVGDSSELAYTDHFDALSDSAGWSLPMLHTAPPGAVSAAVVIEVENTRTDPELSNPKINFIGGPVQNLRVDNVTGQVVPATAPAGSWHWEAIGVRDERYRIGEVAVFPAFAEPTYESWNVQPGQFALPPVEVAEHAHIQGLEVAVHGHKTIELDAPVPVEASMFKPIASATKPQFSRPMQDAHDGGWTKQDGSNEFIWSAIDDLVPDDLDYAQSEHMPEDDLYVGHLTRMANPDPDSDEKYLVHVRYRRRGATPATLRVALYQGEVPIAEWEVETDRMYATVVRELTPAQVASITDYADLRIRLVGDAVPV